MREIKRAIEEQEMAANIEEEVEELNEFQQATRRKSDEAEEEAEEERDNLNNSLTDLNKSMMVSNESFFRDLVNSHESSDLSHY